MNGGNVIKAGFASVLTVLVMIYMGYLYYTGELPPLKLAAYSALLLGLLVKTVKTLIQELKNKENPVAHNEDADASVPEENSI